MEQLVRNHHHAEPLTRVAERLGTGDKQQVVVRIVGHRSLIGRYARLGDVLAEVHAEVGEVFHHDDVVFVGEVADDFQFVFREANPRRVVRVGVEDARDIAFREVFFQFLTQLVAAVVVNVERFVRDLQHVVLLTVYGKARIDEQRRVLAGLGAADGQESREAALHGADGRQAGFGADRDIEEVLDETGDFRLQFGNTVNIGVDGCHAVAECLDFGLDTDLAGGKPRNPHFHADETGAGSGLDVVDEFLDLADGGASHIGQVVLGHDSVHEFFRNNRLSHNMIKCLNLRTNN